MLQQTQVAIVEPYFRSWMKQFPSIKTLSKSQIDDVLKAWEGLGYYQRAHNILFTAQTITSKYNGVFPETYDKLIDLKGIGDYTASAILSIAYNKPYPAIDGNLKRVLSRLYTIKQSPVFDQSIKKMILN